MINTILIVGFAFTFIYILSFLHANKQRSQSGYLLLLVLLITLIEIGNGILISSDAIYTFPHFLRINTPFLFLLAPAFWFIIRIYIYPDTTVVRNFWWHCIPFLLCVLYFLPLYLSSEELKLVYIKELIQGSQSDSYLIGGLRRLQQGIYIVMLIVELVHFKKKNLKGNLPVVLFICFSGTWLLSIVRYFLWFEFQAGLLDVGMLCITSTYLVYTGLVNPLKTPNKKYKTSGLTPELMEKYADKIIQALEKDKIYTNPELTLAALVVHINIPAHQVSQVFSQHIKSSFKEIINKYRIEEAKRLLSNDSNQHLKIEAIGFKAGFCSVSTFNSTFRKQTGENPSSFRLQRKRLALG